MYLLPSPILTSPDTLPARFLPLSIFREGDLDLDEFSVLHDATARGRYALDSGVPGFLAYRRGHYVSRFSPVPAILATPVYLLPVLAGIDPASPALPHLERISASLLTALSVLFLYWAAREVATPGWALAIAAIYAFGTSSFSISSRYLTEHTASQVFLSLLLLLMVKGSAAGRLPHPEAAGLAAGAAVASRLMDVLVVVPLGWHVLRRHPESRLRFVLGGLLPAALLLAYNAHYFGAVYATGHDAAASSAYWGTPVLWGLAGILVSPSRGLLVYSPVLGLGLVGLLASVRRGPPLMRSLGAGVLATLLVYSRWGPWWGGWVWGPRLLADLTPILSFALHRLPVAAPGAWLKPSLGLLAAVSIAVHALGAFSYDARWDEHPNVDFHPDRLWSWRDGQLVYQARQALGTMRRRLDTGDLSVGRSPNSLDAPEGLRARYELTRASRVVAAGDFLPVRLTVTNTGTSAWLARTEDHRGAVRLGWRWLRGAKSLGEPGAREDLRSVVWPGQSYELEAWCRAPAEPGPYVLELELVSERVTWFSQRGVPPVTVDVSVTTRDGLALH
jgi:hypothetical protein